MTGLPPAVTLTRLGRDDARLLFQIARDGIRDRIADHELQLVRARMFPDDPAPQSLSQERPRGEDAADCERALARLRPMLGLVLWAIDALAQKTPEEFAELFAEILREPAREVH
ncbi:MAG: hypothetical protein KIT09_26160 [Bryobacteraceae bacterium]|nr:hypothetical protein [Bryobacteraceae bacterium]